jgi:hypothetical protein
LLYADKNRNERGSNNYASDKKIPVPYNQVSLSATYSSIAGKKIGGTAAVGTVKIRPRFLTCYLLMLAITATVVWIALIICDGLILTVCYKDAKLLFNLQCKIKLK